MEGQESLYYLLPSASFSRGYRLIAYPIVSNLKGTALIAVPGLH